MIRTKTLSLAASCLLFLASCQKEKLLSGNNTIDNGTVNSTAASESSLQNYLGGRGFVYTLSNQVNGNKILTYKRSTNGTLTYYAAYDAGGNGTGSGLGNQGAVIVTGDGEDNEWLLAVNAGSNTISSFRIAGNGNLVLRSTVNSGGTTPVSLTAYNNLVYVLNSGGTGNISGFNLGENGQLNAISNSTKPLSSPAAGAAEISFVRNGKILAITEKAVNKITTYTVTASGRPGTIHSLTSAQPTPFGFAAGRYGNIYVSEAVGGAPNASTVSSYNIAWDGTITLVDGPNATNQTAACWVVLTDDGKYVYSTNTGSASVSSFSVMPSSGNLNLLQSVAGTAGTGPIDAALSDNSKYLYVLNNGSHSISAFAVSANGSLSSIQSVTGLPTGANGLAAF
ncbi:MAG: beta-propeller fold lactonase family protein [Bacteroidetes bacterium]|nr:beta-propeller fold lactonase family protein [Bacteroidota bacterium]